MAKAKKAAKKPLGKKAMKKTKGGVSLNFAKVNSVSTKCPDLG